MKEEQLQRTLKVSFLDGAFASIMLGFTEHFITPFALALNATKIQIGLLVSLPQLVGAIFQIKSPDILEKIGHRKTLVTVTVFLHACMWLPIFAIPFLFKEHPVFFLILFHTMGVFFNQFGSSAWASLMSDLIPSGRRGKYFGWRSKYLGIITVASALTAGFILNLSKGKVFFGFAVIFLIAFVSRMISWGFLRQMHEPHLHIGKEHRFTFREFVARFPKSNFTRFVLYVAFISFFTQLAGPFFSVYMLKELQFSYPVYTTLMITSAMAGLLSMTYWGHLIDTLGSIRVIKILSILIPLAPVMWLFSGNFFYLIAVQIFGGYVWSGYNLATANFIYDTTTSEKRARCIAYYNAINGTAICVGAFLGGYLATHLPPVLGSPLLCLFLLSGALRAVAAATVLPTLQEVRPVAPMSRKDVFLRMTGFRRVNI